MATRQNALLYYGPHRLQASAGEKREDLIQECAYFKASRRRFSPGYELDDWLAAEEEVDALLRHQQDR